ncbi:Uncharacterised protein [Mycobacteroides abscessus subsp. abscessus]|nr:Uncharacterised protein [Mycobacteroides abscessus subsp. abscessus]
MFNILIRDSHTLDCCLMEAVFMGKLKDGTSETALQDGFFYG